MSHKNNKRDNLSFFACTITPEQQQDLLALQQILGYSFCNIKLLYLALTHRSTSGRINYELLEFLGDRVLSLVMGDHLVCVHTDMRQTPKIMGSLVNKFNHLVCGDTLCIIAKKLCLFDYIISEHSIVESMLSDCLEAIIGAIYRDGGLAPARKFILHAWQDLLNNLDDLSYDPKMQLQQWTQSRGLGLPVYELLSTQNDQSGQLVFTVSLTVPGYEAIQASSSKKQKAEQLAASQLLKKINQGADI